ncbi:MAG: oxygen-independent coproporphyrinogen III oxidase-like protein [Burkholderiales bacterium]|nr:oxygen-independent coproporphyrinogen III oxidase-like protein [Burkholderiales bacterium]
MAPAMAPTPRSSPTFRELPPLSLYVHLPWCLAKCPYCDFNSHEWRGGGMPPEDAYVDALVLDLEQALPSVWGRPVSTVFLGGGTPSLFAPEAIDRLLSAVRARVALVPGTEVTMEANPGTFERARFEGYRDAGVNRLSIGVQSFAPRSLAALGRVHDGAEARAAAAAAVELFDEVNLDLMYGLPGQGIDDALADVETALAFRTTHLSCYQLTIEPNTRFHRHRPELPDEDEVADMHEAIAARLASAGFAHYEVSAYARPGHRCLHNLNYWSFGDYLGIGAGAHAKVSMPASIVREVRWKQPKQYMARVAAGEPVMERREVAPVELGFEFMLNALRLVDGVPSALFAERTGVPIASIAREIAAATSRGLLDPDPAVLRATPLGQRFQNELVAMFLRERAPAKAPG